MASRMGGRMHGASSSEFVTSNPMIARTASARGSDRTLKRGPSRPRMQDKEELRIQQRAAVPKLLQAQRLDASGGVLPSKDREWQKPSKSAAIEHANSVHPRTRDVFNDSVPWSVCETRAGRFCYSWCDPLCCEQPSASDLAAMGPGISSYYKLIKALAWLFLIWSLLTIPTVVLVTFGTRGTNFRDTPILAELTLGQLGDDLNVTRVEIIGTNCAAEADAAQPCSITKLQAAQVFTVADLIAVLIFASAYVWIRHMEKKESAVVDVQHVTVQDYTAFIPSVPPFTKPEHVKAHFESVRGSPAVADVQIAEDDADLLRIFVKRGRLYKRVTDLTEQQALARATGQVRRARGLQRRRDRLKARIAKLNAKAKAVKANNRALAAFVTFERHSDFVRVVKLYRRRRFCVCCNDGLDMPVPQVQKRGRRRLAAAMTSITAAAGGTPAASAAPTPEAEISIVPARIKVKAAPAPSTIMWHNLHIRWRSRMMRRSVTAIVSAVLLVLSIVAGFYASIEQANAVGATEGRCDTDATVEQLAAAASAAGAGSDEAACYCAYLSQNDAVTLATSAQAVCRPWATDALLATIATIGAAAAVPVVNGVFKILLKRMAEWEAHHSINSQAESFAQRLFLLTVINTAVLPILINAAIPGLEALPGNKFSDFVPTWYATVGVQITLTMMINVVVPHFSPILKYMAVLLFRRGACAEGCGCGCLGDPGERAASQRQLNSWFEGPQFHLDIRYATVMQTVFVTLLFASMLPVLVPIAFCNMLVSFYVDKWLLLRFYRTPPHYDVHLGRALTAWIPWGLFLHLAVAAYAMSTPQIFASQVTDSQVINDVGAIASTAGTEAAAIAERLSQAHVLALSIAAVVFVGLLLFSKCIGGLTRAARSALAIATCGSCDVEERKEELIPACAKMRFSDARDEGVLEGIPSYSLMQNPDIAKALAINPELVRHKTRVVELRDEIPLEFATENPAARAAKAAVPRPPSSAPGAPIPRPEIFVDPEAPPATDAKVLATGSGRHGGGAHEVFGSPSTAEAWTGAVAGRRERRAAAEAEAASDARTLGTELSSRMLHAWKRGEDEAQRRHAHAHPGAGVGSRHRDFDADEDSDDESVAQYDSDRDRITPGRVDVTMAASAASGASGAGWAAPRAAAHLVSRGRSGMATSPSGSGFRSHGRSGMATSPSEPDSIRRGRSGMATSPSEPDSIRRGRSGMDTSAAAGARAPAAPPPLPPPPALQPGQFIDMDSDDSGESDEDPDWDVAEDRPVQWTGEGGLFRHHSDADGGQRDI